MTLPEAAHFEGPPLGNSASAGRNPDRRHDPASGHDPASAVPPVDRLPVDDPAADHADGGPAPKAADRAAAPRDPLGAPTQVVPLVAANRSEALTPVDAPAFASAAPATVPEQIVSAVVPLHGRGDGRHEVTLELRPDNLGTIRVEVAVEHQTVHLTLHAADPATSRLLSASLPDLRSALAEAGLTAGQVGVGLEGGGAGQRRHPTEGGDGDLRRPVGGGRRVTAIDEPVPVRTFRPAAAGRLDLFL